MLQEIIIIVAALGISLFLLFYIVSAAVNNSKLVTEQKKTNALLRAHLIHSGLPMEAFMTKPQIIASLNDDIKRLKSEWFHGLMTEKEHREAKAKVEEQIARIQAAPQSQYQPNEQSEESWFKRP